MFRTHCTRNPIASGLDRRNPSVARRQDHLGACRQRRPAPHRRPRRLVRPALLRAGHRRADRGAVVAAHQIAAQALGLFRGLDGMDDVGTDAALDHQAAVRPAHRFRAAGGLAPPQLPADHHGCRMHQHDGCLLHAAEQGHGPPVAGPAAAVGRGGRVLRRRRRRTDGRGGTAARHDRPVAIHPMGLDLRGRHIDRRGRRGAQPMGYAAGGLPHRRCVLRGEFCGRVPAGARAAAPAWRLRRLGNGPVAGWSRGRRNAGDLPSAKRAGHRRLSLPVELQPVLLHGAVLLLDGDAAFR